MAHIHVNLVGGHIWRAFHHNIRAALRRHSTRGSRVEQKDRVARNTNVVQRYLLVRVQQAPASRAHPNRATKVSPLVLWPSGPLVAAARSRRIGSSWLLVARRQSCGAERGDEHSAAPRRSLGSLQRSLQKTVRPVAPLPCQSTASPSELLPRGCTARRKALS